MCRNAAIHQPGLMDVDGPLRQQRQNKHAPPAPTEHSPGQTEFWAINQP